MPWAVRAVYTPKGSAVFNTPEAFIARDLREKRD